MNPIRVLLVDDEDSLRQLLARYLVRLGYTVDSVGSAEEAWDLFSQKPSRYALLLIDLSLPGMPGDELMRRVLATNSTARILLSSGFLYDLNELPPDHQSRACFLHKPYLPRQLADLMKKMVGVPKAAAAKA
jgi:two-component system, cell cycle sensor histidine kinase and response regulator CckA